MVKKIYNLFVYTRFFYCLLKKQQAVWRRCLATCCGFNNNKKTWGHKQEFALQIRAEAVCKTILNKREIIVKEIQSNKNPYTITVKGIGYLGEYVKDTNYVKAKELWKFMIKNVKEEKATICNEWKCFGIFYEWFKENYYTINNERMFLNNNIYNQNNKNYDPETCFFLPERLQILFLKTPKKKNLDLPIGCVIMPNCKKKKYTARCSDPDGKQISLGFFYSPDLAFIKYKEYKENMIKMTVRKYKGLIPDDIYNLIYNYEIKEK